MTNDTDVSTAVEVDTDAELSELITLINSYDEILQHTNEYRDKARDKLVNLLLLRETPTVVGMDDLDNLYRVTVVSSETTTVDGEGLRKAIGTRTWNKFTTRKVDNKKIEQALQSGDLSVEAVSPYIEIKQRAKYPRLTRVV